jgi:hypothetical protein
MCDLETWDGHDRETTREEEEEEDEGDTTHLVFDKGDEALDEQLLAEVGVLGGCRNIVELLAGLCEHVLYG